MCISILHLLFHYIYPLEKFIICTLFSLLQALFDPHSLRQPNHAILIIECVNIFNILKFSQDLLKTKKYYFQRSITFSLCHTSKLKLFACELNAILLAIFQTIYGLYFTHPSYQQFY